MSNKPLIIISESVNLEKKSTPSIEITEEPDNFD